MLLQCCFCTPGATAGSFITPVRFIEHCPLLTAAAGDDVEQCHRSHCCCHDMQATLTAYEGCRDGSGLCHGQGRAVFSSGQVYDGQWQQGHMHGEGSIQFPDGISYSGTFASDSISGSGVSAPAGVCALSALSATVQRQLMFMVVPRQQQGSPSTRTQLTFNMRCRCTPGKAQHMRERS